MLVSAKNTCPYSTYKDSNKPSYDDVMNRGLRLTGRFQLLLISLSGRIIQTVSIRFEDNNVSIFFNKGSYVLLVNGTNV